MMSNLNEVPRSYLYFVSSLLGQLSRRKIGVKSCQAVEKLIRVLRQAQHEREFINNFKASSVRPEALEG